MTRSARNIVTAFNDCITRRDIDGLSKLMTDDHVFIDAVNNRISGKARCIEAWNGFFDAFPDYRNRFERVVMVGNEAVIIGHSVCSDVRLAGPALWTAKMEGELIAEWRVYEDTGANRARLGVSD
jgi:ketosteroid isomerase-like protein